MDDSHAMQIAQTIGQRINNTERFFLGENRSSADPIEQFAALQKLHHNVNRLRLSYYSKRTSFDSNVSISSTMFLCCTNVKIAISVWIRPASFYIKHPFHPNFGEFRFINDLHRTLLQRFLIHTLRLIAFAHSYAIDRRETTLSDLLSNVVVVLDLPHLRHVSDHVHPVLAFLLARREELTVVRRRELHSEAVIPRSAVGSIVDATLRAKRRRLQLHSGFLHRHNDVRRLRVDVRVDVHELVVDAHEVLLHPVEQRGGVELSAVLLHIALSLIAALNANVHARNLHTRVHLLVTELMAAVRAESHGDHAMTLRTLQFLQRIVASAFFIHRKQLALTHTAEPDFFLTMRTRQTPVRSREAHPSLRIALLRRASKEVSEKTDRKPVGSGFVDVWIDRIKGNGFVGVVRFERVHKRVVVRDDRVAVERYVAFRGVENCLRRIQCESIRGNSR